MGLRAAWRALRERKVSAAGPLISSHNVGQAIWSDRNYAKFAEEGFRKNVVVFKAIQEVVRGAASVPWLLFRSGAETRQELTDHPLLTLLNRPNPFQAKSEFIEAVLGFYLIAGNSYIEAVGPTDGKEPLELWTLRPDRMLIIAGKHGIPSSYKYSVGGSSRSWPVNPITGESAIRHLKTFNPLNDWYGLSPIEAAAISVDQRNQADTWNMSLLRNSARPSGALVVKPDKEGNANLTEDQFERGKKQLDELAKNPGRPLLFEGNLSWEQMGLSPTDMDFLNTKNTSSRDIAIALGVPPQLLGIPGDSTFSNYREARLALWEETIVPLLRHLRDELNGWLVPMFGDDLELDTDLDEVPALTLRREKKFAMVQNADFLMINEKREAVGYGEIEGGDVLLVPATMLPLGTATAEEPSEDEIDKMEHDHLELVSYGGPAGTEPGRTAA